jgi:molybdopterin-guanine dinucleotide biosynthesis protein
LPGLIKTVIKVNGAYYAGEDDSEYASSSFTGVGWTDYKGNKLNGLKFVDDIQDATIVEGYRCLNSALEKILLRLRDGIVEFDRIEIIRL